MGRLRRLLHSRPVEALAIGVLVAALLQGAERLGWLQFAELRLYDLGVAARASAAPPEERVVLARITERELAALGHPLPDETLARVLQTLGEMGPRAIGVDLYRDRPVPPGAERLQAVLSDNPRIVLIEKFGAVPEEGIPAPDYLGPGQVGFSDTLIDRDGVVRRGLLFLWDQAGDAHVSLSLQLAATYLADEGLGIGASPDDPNTVSLGPMPIPFVEPNDGGYVGVDAGGYQHLLDYRARPGSVRSFTVGDLLDGKVEPADVRDRIVILGTTAPSVKDEFLTPLGLVLGAQEMPTLYGIELHARTAAQLLRHALDDGLPTRTPSAAAAIAWLTAWAVLGALLGIWPRSLAVLIAGSLAGLAAVVGTGWLALWSSWWIPMAAPALGWLGSVGLATTRVLRRERRERSLVSDLFARHVQKDVFDSIWQNREQFMAGGRPRPQRLTVTIMMTDLKGYTSASEGMDPVALMDWINEYMDAMAGLIESHGGVVDDYAGDGIKANFGVPFPRSSEEEIDRDAQAAVEATLAMHREMEALNARWTERGLPTGRTRIGLYTGSAVVGSLGSSGKLKYTTVGDSVNTAARLESFDKESFEAEDCVCRILIGDTTLTRLHGRYRAEDLGLQRLKGKDEEIRVHRVLGRASCTPHQREVAGRAERRAQPQSPVSSG